MEMRKCMKGHYYDASINSSCPYCNSAQGDGMTIPMNFAPQAQDMDDSKTLPLGYTAQAEPTPAPIPASAAAPRPIMQPSFSQPSVDDDDDGKTVAIIHHDMGIDPVVGWLVCIDGKEKGKDYRIHTDNNFVGRSERMDICIRGDETISRENHAIVSYDGVDKIFYFSPGDGRSIVRLNDKAIFQTMQLQAYDKLVIGKTTFLFIPLCGDNFEWNGDN